ncbi:MAG: radical SAM protein [Bacilli bacterium]
MDNCPACGRSPQDECDAARCARRDPAYIAVKDHWLDIRRAGARDETDTALEWAISSGTGGILAQWNFNASRFVPIDHQPAAGAEHRYAWFEVTAHCPHRCRHCYLGARLGGPHASTDMLLEAFAALPSLQVTELVLAGGEPTVHPDFVAILAAACEVVPHIRVLTNGWTQGNAVVTALASPRVSVEVPLLGWEEDHDWMVQTPGSFDRIMQSLRLYVEAGVTLTLTTTLTRSGIRALPRLRALASELGIPFQPSELFAEGHALEHWTEIAPEPEFATG